MGQRTPRKRRASGTLKTSPDPATIGPLLRQFGFVGTEADPTSVTATFDADGEPRRVMATYEGGWHADLRLNASGSYSLTQSISMRVTGRKPS